MEEIVNDQLFYSLELEDIDIHFEIIEDDKLELTIVGDEHICTVISKAEAKKISRVLDNWISFNRLVR